MSSHQPKPWQRPALIGAVAVLGISAWGAYAMRPHHTARPPSARSAPQSSTPPAGMTAPALVPLPAHLVVGQSVTTVITVSTATAGTLDGDVLIRTSAGRVSSNGQHVHVAYTPTRITMGSLTDIKAGAILEVDATVMATTTTGVDLSADQLVDLTGVITPS